MNHLARVAFFVLPLIGVAACDNHASIGGGDAAGLGLNPGVSLSGNWNVKRTVLTAIGSGCDPLGAIGPLAATMLHTGNTVQVTSGAYEYTGTLAGVTVSFRRSHPPLPEDEDDQFDITFDPAGTVFSGTYRKNRSGCNETGETAGSKGPPPTPPECCPTMPPATFTVDFPVLGEPPHDPGENWPRPNVWGSVQLPPFDSIEVPNGRPIYALFVSGYGNNGHLDEMMCYNFARHLMARGAYVHYAWWNNLLAPYMERPLHHGQSYPGDVIVDADKFNSLAAAADKAFPGEDYQFVADAKRFLAAVREHNPSAMIILVGHSMGGSSVVHLGAPWTTPGDPPMPVIDILALLDPGNNRNFPWGGVTPLPPLAGFPSNGQDWLNRTRWRATRASFAGFKRRNIFCNPVGDWQYDIADAPWGLCLQGPFYDASAPTLTFPGQVVNLYHRWQIEYAPPFDFSYEWTFGHQAPAGGSTSPQRVATRDSGPDIANGQGWPIGINFECCPTGSGVGWPQDGHGEIVGWRGPITLIPPQAPQPLGVRLRTSPECTPSSGCNPVMWPARGSTLQAGAFTWAPYNSPTNESTLRHDELVALESLPEPPSSALDTWPHRPTNADLCLVSPGLNDLFDTMNRPPSADAGPNQMVAANAGTAAVLLDGMQSSDPDPNDALTYTWTWATGSATGGMTVVTLPIGEYCITLTVSDPTGHIDRDQVCVTVTRAPW